MTSDDQQASDSAAAVPTPQDDTGSAGRSSLPDPGRAGRAWSGRRTVAVVAVAVGIAAAGGGAIAAAGSSGIGNVALTGTDYGSGEGYGAGPGEGGRPGGGHGRPGMGPGGALHGEFVVPDGNGGYATRLMQTGTVTEVDGDSITVASEDGYVMTYAITSSTTVHGVDAVTDIEVGAKVTVVADQDGTALSIGDRSAMPERGHGRRGPGGPGGPGQEPPSQAPPSTETAPPGSSSEPSPTTAPSPTT